MDKERQDKIAEMVSAKPSFEQEIANALDMPRDTVISILKSDRHRFKRTGFMKIGGVVIDREWDITRIYKAERFGRKTPPRVRKAKAGRRWDW